MVKTFRVLVSLSFAVLVIALNDSAPQPSKAEGGSHRPALRGEPPSYDVQRPPTPEGAGDQATIEVQVDDTDKHVGVPCRVVVLNESGALVNVSAHPGQRLAVRAGVIYTPDGRATISLAPGTYTLFATRGFEYSRATRKLTLAPGEGRQVRMKLRREVPTPGLISCDTHVHTHTYSKHGDATIDERVITLAGEGVELPIATEHDRPADYSEPQKRAGLRPYFTPVSGIEVTTKKGHFNIFPVRPGGIAPDPRVEDWSQLMKSFRATPGVQVVVLNHPRDLHSNFRPFDPVNFNAVTGENLRGGAFSFDALEVLNSGALQSDFMRLYHDWFALLNGGQRVTSVGSSDSHDVDGYIVGQGRTFIAYGRDDEPAAIDINEACRNLLRGRAFVSLGLLTRMTVEGKFGVGDLAAVKGRRMRVTVSVLGPSWVSADRVELFANGVKIRGREVTAAAGAVEKAKVTWTLPRPSHDVHLVAIASGPGVTVPYWPMARPSQPTSATWKPRVIGSTNPVWVDADGDGSYTHPRAYAASMVKRSGADPATLLRGLAPYDQAVAAQAASLYSAAGHDLRGEKFQRLLRTSAAAVRRGFDLYTATLPRR